MLDQSVLFGFITFILGIGAFEFSKDKTDLVVSYANAGVTNCGCSKCHIVELDGCVGCHNKQSKQESDDPLSRPEGPHEDESANPENAPESQKTQSSSVETLNSEPVEPKHEDRGESETVSKKSARTRPSP